MDKETTNWGGPEFIKVTESQFRNFAKAFKGKIEGNAYMGWYDLWDFSLNKKAKKNAYKYFDECVVARNYFETPQPEYYVRLDYIEANRYDLDTVVEEPEEPKMTEEETLLLKCIIKAMDSAFVEKNIIEPVHVKWNEVNKK